MNKIPVEFYGAELTFGLPDWFPPEAQEYCVKHKDWTTTYGNHALDALYEIEHVNNSVVHGVAGNWVTFKFDEINPSQIAPLVPRCKKIIFEFLQKWSKPIAEHEYCVQGRGLGTSYVQDGVYEVLDLSASSELVYHGSYKECNDWIDQEIEDTETDIESNGTVHGKNLNEKVSK